MPTYTATIRYNDSGTPTNAALTITAAAADLAYVKDGDTYKVVDDGGDTYIFPENVLIFMKFVES